MSKFNTFLAAIGMVFFAFAAQAQLSFTMVPSDSAPGLGEQFTVDVVVNADFQEIASFQYTISWDQTKFSYQSLSNFGLPGLGGGSFGTTQTANGRITVSWSDPMAGSQSINTDSTIYTITFDVIATEASTSDISFTSTPLSKEIITQDAMGNFDDITGSTIFNNASIDIAGGGGPGPVCDFTGFGLIVTSDSADTGDPVCLDVIACNFSEIVSFQYTTQFDPDKLQFDSLTNFNLDNLSAGNFGTTNVGNGFITSSWLDTLGAGITVTDETVLYSVCFTAIGAGGDMDTVAINGALSPIEVTDANSGGSDIGLESIDGEVNITGNASSAVSVRASCEQGSPGDTVTVAVSVSNFDSISGLQMSMLWDPDIIDFLDTEWTGQLPGSPTFNTNSTLTDAGKLALLWDDPMGQTSSVMDDSIIFNVRYIIIGEVAEVSTVSFTDDPTTIEVSQVVNGTLQTVPLARIQGKVEVIGEGVLGFIIEDATGCTGDTICIPVTVDNFNEIVSMQYDFTWDDAKLDYIRTQDHNATLEGLSAGSFNQYAADALRLSWTQALLEPRTLAEGNDTLYRVCFEVLGADGTTADLSFDETQTVEISGGDPIDIINTYTLDNSLITVSCAMDVPMTVSDTTITNVACNGGSTGAITLTLSDETGTVTFNWSTGATTQNISGLAAGAYTVTIADDNTTLVETYTVTEPASALSVSMSSTDVSVNGGSDGTATATPSGGTSPYSYNWSNGGSTSTITGLTFGTYTVTVTDDNGCTITDQVAVNQPGSVTAVINSTNISCNGAADGSATVTPGGGVPGYTYLWSNGATTATVSGLTPGNYSVTVTDTNSATATASVTITQPAVLTASLSGTDVSCNGDTDGQASVSVVGGTPGFTYLWSNGATTDMISNVSPGTYSVTVTDMNSCTASGSVMIGEPAAVTATISASADVSCNGFDDGSATVTPGGGTGTGFTYAWSNSATTATITSLPPGTYNVTVTDSDGCTATTSVTITEPSAVTATISSTNVACNGVNNGTASVTPGGGSGSGFTYSWSTGATTSSITNLSANTYSVTVMDSEGCTANASVTITEPSAVTATISSTNVACNGVNNGTASVTPGGGSGSGFTYSWSTGATTSSITNLSANTYSVTVMDSDGCTANASVTITEPSAVTASISSTNSTCNGDNNGSATVTPGGGSGIGYTYSWSSGATTATITDLAPGTYSVTVMDSDGCTGNASVTITEPSAVTASISSTNSTCNGDNNGSATVTPGGGSGIGYTYSWSSGATTATITDLAPGTYSVTVMDSDGCTGNASVTITEPSAVTASISSTNSTCNGDNNGSATVTPGGGSGSGYTYSWSSGATTATITDLAPGTYSVTVMDSDGCTGNTSVTITEPSAVTATITSSTDVTCNGESTGSATVTPGGGSGSGYIFNWSNSATTASVTGLIAGTYNVTVTDSEGCAGTTSVIIDEPTSALSVSMSSTDVSVNGGSDGTATATPSGGTSPYTYLWSNGGTTASITGLTFGTYTVTVTDTNGCTITDQVAVNQPGSVTAIINATNISCNGAADGSATVTPGGGIPGYTYLWSNGATTATIIGLAPGSYTVTVTDTNSATATASATITQPDLLTATTNSTDVSCNGEADGQASVSVGGGTPAYTYLWSSGETVAMINNKTAGSYTVTVTDANGCTATGAVTISESAAVTATITSSTDATCNGESTGSATVTPGGGSGSGYIFNWSNSGTTATVTGLTAGTYNVTVTDSEGCAATTSVVINEPSLVTATITSSTDVACNGESTGSATVTPGGGSGSGYIFNWSNSGTTATVTGLIAGTYNVTVTDSEGCAATTSVVINEPASALSVSMSSTDVSINGGSDGTATATPSGGTSPYTYLWSNGGTTASITGLSFGTYTVTVTDTNGCTITDQVAVNQPGSVTAIINATNISCNGAADGSATVTPGGGIPGYTYLWSNGATTTTITGLAPGSYTVTVTDTNSATATASVTITQPDLLIATTNSTDVSCNGEADGEASVSVGGGTPGYTYLWSSGEMLASINNKAPGSYTVTVTDANSCTATGSVTISELPAVVATITTSMDADCGSTNGAATVSPGGGSGTGYTFEWSNGATTATASSLAPGTYTVTVTDSNGCLANTSVTIMELGSTVTASISSSTDVSCSGADNGTATVTPGGGSGSGYTYAWSNGATTATASNLVPGTYTVTVTDSDGCTATTSVNISEGTSTVTATVVSSSNVSCNGGSDGTAAVSAGGGSGTGYTYAWSNGATTSTITDLIPGTYTVTVTDSDGCTATTSVSITEPTALSATLSKTDITCSGDDDGSVTASASGGTGAYSYVWSNGATGNSISGLAPGNYIVTVTDENACSISGSISITEPNELIVTGSVSNESAANAEDGAIDITPLGGTQPWTYSWSNGATTQDISGLTPGMYTVTITDANSCTVSESFTVNPFEAPQITVENVIDVSCNGGSTGQIDISVAGGVSPYTYLWSNGATTQDISGLSAGNYTITVTDNIGTTAAQTITVAQPTPITITIDGQTDVACNGDNTGSIKITASGGTPGYTYNWGSGITAEDPAGLTVGTYIVTVTDANGCTAVGPAITLGQPNEIAITLSGTTNVACNGESTGSIEVTITGGTPGYSYSWSNGSTMQDPSGLAAGTYTLTVTDAANCMEVSQAITISEPTALSVSSSATSVTCNGASDGTMSVNVAGGSPPYSYNWSGGLPNQPNHINVSAGTYAVTITDIVGCSIVEGPIAVTQPAALTLTNSIINASASNDDGSINLMVSGGTPAYNYEWNTGATTEDLSGLASGCYIVTVTDDNGCTAIDSIKVGGVIVISAVTSNTSCAGLCDGSIDLTVEGGIAPYIYTWTGADVVSNAQDQNDLCAGSYAVTIVDANGTQAIQSFVITSPTALTVASSSINNETGNGCNGSVDITITGGTLPYTYQWSNGAISEDVDDLCKGDYSVTIVDANGCVLISSQFTVLPAPLVVSMSSMSMASCFGESDGEACISVLGGCGPYTVSLGGSTQVSVSGEDVCFADLAAGTYTVNVVDSGNPQMSISQNFTITTPGAISINSNVINNTDPTGANCDGAIDISVTGGTVPYTYQWSNGSTSEDITNLCSGGPTFSVTVTDANGCIEILSGLEVELGLNLQVIATEDVSCFADCDGSINISVTGGDGPYTYNWSNAGTTQDLNNLCAGSYDVTVTDANGQMASFTGIIIAEPAAPLSVEMGTMERPTADNADGSITLDISGGWGGYTIEWSNGASGNPIGGLIEGFYTATVMDANGCVEVITIELEAYRLAIASSFSTPSCNGDADGQIEVVVQGGSGDFSINWDNGQAGELAFDLTAGTYCVTISDNQIAGLQLVQCFDLTEPARLSADPIVVNSTGPADGSIDANISGGTAPYNYLWTSGDITPVTAGLTSGTYGLVVTDDNGCELIIQQIEVGVEGECFEGRRVISPNGDGKNDEFIISCVEGINNNLKVFNRWGQLVYEADNYDNSWAGTDASGKVLPESGYFWVLEYEENGQTKQLKGAFTLLRGDN